MSPVAEHIEEIKALCKTYKVDRLYVFGSVLTDKFNANSDIDFLVEFKPMPVLDRGDAYLDLLLDLEDALGREIDLLSSSSIKNPYLREAIDLEKVSIYD